MTLYRPFFKSAARHSMGIKALDPADWIQFGEDFSHQMQVRRLLLDERRDDVLATLPGSEAATNELSALVLDHLERHAGDRYRIDRNAVVEPGTGWRCQRNDLPVLELVGSLVQEDFCLLERRDERYVLTAAVLCFPAHWSLAEKMGKPLIDIHAPVPGFAEQLGNPIERLFDSLSPEKPVQRLNWSLVDTDKIYLPPSHRRDRVQIAENQIGEALRLRVERQTLRRLARSNAVVFGIRTYVHPLSAAIDGPEAAAALLARLGDMPAPMQSYKNLIDVKPALVAYLKSRQD
jgi:hypothetical protein